ncbi:MAG: HNH endonuclease [Planctomycetes bacterium]|nr:HNH endonuclease [Planctomycetota bacterium]
MPLDTDSALVGAATAEGALELALGEGLDRLFAGVRLLRLGYATERDYARERLGIPARTMRDSLALGRVCRGRPLLRRAVAAGLVSPCKARAIAPVVGSHEAAWTALAMDATVRELIAAVRAQGKEPPEEFETESLRVRMPAALQDKLDAALKRADETLGGGAPRWQCYDALAQEYLSEHGGFAPEEVAGGVRGPDPPPEPPPMPLPDRVAEHLAVIAEARALVADEVPATTDPVALDAFLMRLMKALRARDAVLGALALRAVAEKAWLGAGYATLKEYCLERLGIAPSAFRQRVWLERRMFAVPPLREALENGVLTYSKALLVAQDATLETVADLIARAAGTTWQQTAREAAEREDRRNRAAGVRRLWAPKDVMATVKAAIAAAVRKARGEGREIGASEALAEIAEHFLRTWPADRLRKLSRSRRQVLSRNGGTCEVPGCSLPGRHEHHIRYRSHGGTDDPWNKVRLCVAHHLRGIHDGYLTVEGRAGERLVWRFGTGEIFETLRDNDVRRADAAAAGCDDAPCVSESAAPAYAVPGREVAAAVAA